MPSLVVRDLTFSFSDAAPLFSRVSLHLTDGWTGLVGPNGGGKTTLLRLLAGELCPEGGVVRVMPANARIAFCAQRTDARGGGTDAERDRWATRSPGERKRGQLDRALADSPGILLLDEPTNHLDDEARARIVRALGRFRGVGVVVSHDRALLDALTSCTVRVTDGDARAWRGGYSAAKREWEAEEALRSEARARIQRETRTREARLNDARRSHLAADTARSMRGQSKGPRDHDARNSVAKGRAAAGEKRAGRDVTVAREALARSEARLGAAPRVTKELGGALFADHARAPAARVLALDADALYAGSRAILRDVHVTVARGARVRIHGVNGAGKTPLLSALADRSAHPGRLLVLPQETRREDDAALVRDVRALAPDVRGAVLSFVAALGASPPRLMASEAPSLGEARKLRIALGLGRRAWALVLDEPTNHLDLPSIERLERALVDFPGAIVLVSHDAAFARAVTADTWRVEGGRVHVG